ncbi:MAG: DUF4136 domain-containing protein [Nitrospirales bacterium]|nr:DUF4136 domain-containing protein [Nitrospirales bacterium]
MKKSLCPPCDFLVFFWMLVLVGCAANSIEVNSDYDVSTDFPSYHTYQWLKVSEEITGDSRLDEFLLHRQIQMTVDQHMSEKGFLKASTNPPDFLVNYHITVKKALDINTVQDVYGYRPHSMRGWSSVVISAYAEQLKEGFLLLDIIDAKSHSLVWRGTAKGFVEISITPEERKKRISEIIKQVLTRFPPNNKG